MALFVSMKIIYRFFLFLFITSNCYGQQNYKTLTGKLLNYKNSVGNAAILNLNTQLGTISNDKGEFSIKVKLKDTLLITSIQYRVKKIGITNEILNSLKPITIQLIPSVTILKEVFVRRKITGDLALDSKNKPKNKSPKSNFKITNSEINSFAFKYITPDYIKPPNAESFTNPIQMNGVGGSASIPDKRYEKLKKLRKTIRQKKDFPDKIVETLGINFFVNDLQIPKEKIPNFLSYCEYNDIIKKYYNHQLLDVIKILQNESKTYLKEVSQ